LALKLNPEYTDAHYNLGIAYKEKGLLNEAIKEFEETLKIQPDHEKAREMLESLSND
jgi:tetratricopeptide (TPR) repeat protein